jgi:hypothetical protein
MMIQHKFAVGQFVDFDTRIASTGKLRGPFEVVRLLPSDDAPARAYRVKSETEPFERSAKEYEIIAVG